MTKKGYFKDARLLEALEYIDQDLIGEVAVKLKFDENAVLTEEPAMTWRTPFKHWKRMIAAVACLLLLSAAFPVLNYAVQRFGTGIWEGNAGAGSDVIETPPPTATEAELIDSGFDKYLEAFANMSADEIYAEVLKGGWIVQDSDSSSLFDAGEDLWQEFLLSVDNKKPITVLFADFTASDIYVDLSKICYDGELFTITRQRRDQTSVLETETKEFKYFLRSKRSYYFFANNPDSDPAHIISSNSEDILNIDFDSHFVVIVSIN